MGKAKVQRRSRTARQGSPSRRTRISSWLLPLGVAAIGLVAGILYLRAGSEPPGDADTMGEQVTAFSLPDVVTGRNVSLSDYLGKQEVVIVSYMGWFCVGCEELLLELQTRQADFQERDAALMVLGSRPEPLNIAEEHARLAGITYPLLYDASTRVTKDLGLWSNHMQMPWMGYLIINESGQVVASDLQLAEAKGAAPRNVDAILAALDTATAAR